MIKRTGMSTIQAHGMKEVYENATEQVTLETGNTFKAATLPGIVLRALTIQILACNTCNTLPNARHTASNAISTRSKPTNGMITFKAVIITKATRQAVPAG